MVGGGGGGGAGRRRSTSTSGGGGGGGTSSSSSSWSLKKIIAQTCSSFSSWNASSSRTTTHNQTNSGGYDQFLHTPSYCYSNHHNAASLHLNNICAICLDPLNYNSAPDLDGDASPSPSLAAAAIFTAQCSHAFHFSCISSNVRHGSLTCPICRAHWTHLPRNSLQPTHHHHHQSEDPILQILDDSIASFRVHRRSFLLSSARYDDDDPIHHHHQIHHHRLRIYLLPFHLTSTTATHPPPNKNNIHLFPRIKSGGTKLCPSPSPSPLLPPPHHGHSCSHRPCTSTAAYDFDFVRACLCVRLEHQAATDLVLVASPNGPHLRLMKQAMALVILSLRPEDRLSIVAYSSAAARMLPLKRMTSCGKRSALQVIDRLFYTGTADPRVGLNKGLKVLNDRVYRNPESCILHLSDSPTTRYDNYNYNLGGGSVEEVGVKVYRFHVGFGFGRSQGFVMHEFEEFLGGMLGGAMRDIRLKMKEDGRVIDLGELRGGEERRVPLLLPKSGQYCVEYSYVEGDGAEESKTTGEMLIGVGVGGEQSERNQQQHGGLEVMSGGGRRSSATGESWEYRHDTFMARRWAKHLHGGKRL